MKLSSRTFVKSLKVWCTLEKAQYYSQSQWKQIPCASIYGSGQRGNQEINFSDAKMEGKFSWEAKQCLQMLWFNLSSHPNTCFIHFHCFLSVPFPSRMTAWKFNGWEGYMYETISTGSLEKLNEVIAPTLPSLDLSIEVSVTAMSPSVIPHVVDLALNHFQITVLLMIIFPLCSEQIWKHIWLCHGSKLILMDLLIDWFIHTGTLLTETFRSRL